MKKLGLSLLLVLVVCLFAFGATACNRASTEGQIENVFFHIQDGATESYEYDVTNSDNGATGTYKTSIKYYRANTTPIELSEYNKVSDYSNGYLFTSELTMSDGYSSKSACYFVVSTVSGVQSSFLKPVAAYKKVTGSSNDYIQYGTYNGKNYDYTLITSETKEGSVAVGATKVYDNSEFHNSVRGVNKDIFSSGFSLSFNVPVVTADEQGAAAITAKTVGLSHIETNIMNGENKVTYESYAVSISRSTKVPGVTQAIWYAKDDVEYNGFTIRHMITRIAEGTVVYKLKSFSLSL